MRSGPEATPQTRLRSIRRRSKNELKISPLCEELAEPASFVEHKHELDLSPKLKQAVKTQNPSKGELSHGIVEKDVHQRVQAGGHPAAGAGRLNRGGGTGIGSEPERAASLAARVSAGARQRVSRERKAALVGRADRGTGA